MKKIVFSSDQLPDHLDNQARFSLWYDMWTGLVGAAEMAHSDDRLFYSSVEAVPLGETSVSRFETTTDLWARRRHHLSSNEREDFTICFSRGQFPQSFEQRDQQPILTPGCVLVTTNALPAKSMTSGKVSWNMAFVPRSRVLERAPGADAQLATLLDPFNPLVRHLGRYVDFLLQSPEVDGNPALITRANDMLVDLVVLALGARGEAAEMASARGLRAARLREIVAAIQTRFMDPAFSTDRVANSLGLSRRYVNDLLSDTGESFSERVLELRLQKARTMLSDARYDAMRVSDIAFACGFNEVSYFNRRFRARFGCSPTQYRGSSS
ncbi:AraC family transcriptional regulator [Pseudorhodoplanes sinuspersici]|uniref:AraC family transcriptional regulator n=1 Tax=Pseudorhodoplanes sinuspersici TaxID=1235591 RepID=UPI001602AA44|nr:AraC family transcriptional regulator [Pseudorhodoplanes sinuspersici]